MNLYVIRRNGIAWEVYAYSEADALAWYGWNRNEIDSITKE